MMRSTRSEATRTCHPADFWPLLGAGWPARRAARRGARRGKLTSPCISRWRRPGSIRPRRRHHHAVPAAVRAARRDGEADAGGNPAPCLAESWTAARGRAELRFRAAQGRKFHNGDPVTAEDVKFSFERYRGAAHDMLKERVAAVETPDPRHVRFRLKKPWPDFLTFYPVATGAGWIVPKQVCREGRRGRVQEGADRRRAIQVRLVHAGRRTGARGVRAILAQDAGGEAHRHEGDPGRIDPAGRTEARRGRHRLFDPRRTRRGGARTPGLTLKPAVGSAPYWIYFPEQWDPEVAVARSCACARRSISRIDRNDDERGADTRLFASHRQRRSREFRVLLAAAAAGVRSRTRRASCWPRPAIRTASTPGFYYCDVAYANIGEVAVNNLATVGIRVRLRPIERAAFFKGYAEKKFKNIIQGATARSATPRRGWKLRGQGRRLCLRQLSRDRRAVPAAGGRAGPRETRGDPATRCSSCVHEKAIYAPIWQLAFINGVGPRVGAVGFRPDQGLSSTPRPIEEITLKILA